MVQLERVKGQRGHMIIHEQDGTIISSSGDLANSEATANQLVNLAQHSLPVNFNVPINGHGAESNGAPTAPTPALDHSHHKGMNGDSSTGQVWKWNRLTVDFGDHSYIACLSNRKIHIVKRDHIFPDADHVNG